ncbi:MAG: hypothetical protein ACJAT2_000759 [Bacteriovoracaceae bacterium]|jgi:hypothetical protein
MRTAYLILPFILIVAACNPFAKKPLPDKRAGIPGSAQVNNYLEQAVTPQSVHCLEEQAETPSAEKTFYHDGYAKISTNLVGRDVSYRWDESWNKSIGESLEIEHPEFINDDLGLSSDELSDLGCRGLKSAGKADKKRFWALFMATIARTQSGFDPSFKEGSGRGLFALDPNKVNPIGGACAGKDEWDFMEPSYSFSCVFEILKKQIKNTGKLFSPIATDNFLLKALTGNNRGEFFKFFRAHAAPQFSFCTEGFEAPSTLINSNVEGEKVSKDCTVKSKDRVLEGLDRSQTKGQKSIDTETSSGENDSSVQGGEGSGGDSATGPQDSKTSEGLSK